jgi:16S rRNA (cytidine1402-2'-O)-methyltransferase
MSTLYIIATPIGNLKDITYRAVETLFTVDILLCEDTRVTQKLLKHHQKIQPTYTIPKLLSYHEHNEDQKITQVIQALQKKQTVGLVSDAGTPLISDPGYKLVKLCQKKGIKVTPIPGPSAITAALSIAGLPTDKFTFLSFLPRKQNKQEKLLTQIQNSNLSQTIIFYESPKRLPKTLQSIKNIFGDINITIVRELTKIYEEVITKPISQWQQTQEPKGELVILFNIPNL